MFNFSHSEDRFYDFFVENSQIIYDAAVLLQNYMLDLENADENLKNIKEMERKGDQKVHEILKQLNQTFLTPFDREDIYLITKEMDNILDYIESTASRFVLFGVNYSTDEAKTLCEMIVSSTRELIKIMEELRFMNKSPLLKEKIIEVNRIEEEGDSVSRRALKELFVSDKPVLDIIKWKEIYQHLENTLDSCEDVANLIEGVVMKNA